MQYHPLGSSGLKVSSISLGSWLTYGNSVDQSTTDGIVHTAFERGVNLFDTADVYHDGEGEIALGRALRDIPRHRLVLASKCFFAMSDDPNDRGLSRKHIHESIDKSLQRLRTDYLDLYQCHRADPETPLHETARAMDDLIRSGKILYWGVSHWPADMIAEVVTLCRQHGWAPPISNQPPYNLLDRHIEERVVPTCERCGLGQIVFSPLAQGVLTGKYRPGAAPPPDSRGANREQKHFVEHFLAEGILRQVAGLVTLAERQDTTPARLALAFCLRLPNVVSVIVGARTAGQLEDNLGALDIPLSTTLVQELEDLFPS